MAVLTAAERAAIRGNQSNVPTAVNFAPVPAGSSYSPILIEQTLNRYIEGLNATPDASTFPIDLPVNGPHITIEAGTYRRLNFTTIGKIEPQKQIRLPVPNSVMDHHTVVYSQEELGATVGAGLGAASSLFKGQSLNKSQASTQQTITDAGIAAGVDAARAVTPGNVQNATSALTGLAINDYLTILFKGPAYKKYSFEWKLAPRNQKESDIIRDIVVYLNNAMAPSLWAGTVIFGYPDIFRCAFSDKIRGYMYEFKPSVLEDLQVNYYGSGSPSFYPTGAPESVNIRMSFLELEFWLKGQFGNQYNENNVPSGGIPGTGNLGIPGVNPNPVGGVTPSTPPIGSIPRAGN